jgi:hypothetical protein
MPILLSVFLLIGCDLETSTQSDSGVTKHSVAVETNSDGITIEQENVGRRLIEDTKVGSIKHLYVISSFTGQTIYYSTVKGKVTSSGKRLTPKGVVSNGRDGVRTGFTIGIGNSSYETDEVLGDDGTYGSSVSYLYWWDTKDIYHQLYVTGGQIIMVSSEPRTFKGLILNTEQILSDSK